ncbi:MAG: chorismate mutase [Corynebacteriales bacterium]|nr:chorismate mutase [Mycobacteriales bacterium]
MQSTIESPIPALRDRIDEIDRQIIALWQERAEVSGKVGKERIATGGTRLSLAREQAIISKFQRELGPVGARLALLILEAGRGAL